jgi:hypothetical protein
LFFATSNPSYENGLTAKTTTGKLNLEMICFTELVTRYGSVGIPDFEALSKRIGVLLASIMFSLEGITGSPRISACRDT